VPKSIVYDNLWTPPVQDELLAAGGIGCVNLSGLSLERTRSWPWWESAASDLITPATSRALS